MNTGERDELIFKLKIISLRDSHQLLFGEQIDSVGFLNVEYGHLPSSININNLAFLSDDDLISLATLAGIKKAPATAKADIYINHIGVSLKSNHAANPAIVNHTRRSGFEFACKQAGVDITILDSMIDNYWTMRLRGDISEDTKITDPGCPFANYKEYFAPLLSYFLFQGTGSKISKAPADYLIHFTNPLETGTYVKISKNDFIDELWYKLVFSLRAKKGMPKNYNPNTYRKPDATSTKKWVRYCDNEYRGALHIRASR